MKCTIPEISWHNKEPVLSVDIQHVEHVDSKFYRLASGGSDNHVLIWQVKIQENGAASIELLSDLTRHQRSVNVVRWSPNAQYLASADDDANIIIWILKVDNIPSLDWEDDNKESWIVHKVLRGHKEDIYDMCWSPDGTKLLTGSIDNTAIVWDVSKGKIEHIITDHKSFVQGVAWNPTQQPAYMATLSSDRTCRILDTSSARYQVRYRIARGTLPLPPTHPLSASALSGTDACDTVMSGVKLFHDDTFRTYFRRLAFTPDGSLLLVPSGYAEIGDAGKGEGDGKVNDRGVLYGTYVFPTMGSFNSPSAILVSPRQCTIAVRCCPLLFELRPNGPDPYIQLPYRMVFAIATDSDVVLYDTQQTAPFAHLQNIHYTRLTDLTWSLDGRILTAASTDGFCTIVTFEPEELGKIYVKEDSEVEESFLNVSGEVIEMPIETEQENIASITNSVEKQMKNKRPSFLEQWTKVSKTSTKTDVSIKEASPSGSKEFHKETEISTPKLKRGNESVSKTRTVLFEAESDQIKELSSKDYTGDDFDCEFIDLSNSLRKDVDKKKKRIMPTLLYKTTHTVSESGIKFCRRITPTLISSKNSATNDQRNDFNKYNITPTLTGEGEHVSNRNADDSTNDIKASFADNEIIDLVGSKKITVENKSSKRSLSPAFNIESKPPPSAKKIKTNTLLNFVKRGPKLTESSSNNQDSGKSDYITSNRLIYNEYSKIESKKVVLKEDRILTVKLVNIFAEESARDAWKCEQISNSTNLEVTEDIPDDFKLQLEESTNITMHEPKLHPEAEKVLNSEDDLIFITNVAIDLHKEVVTCKDNLKEINDVVSINSSEVISEQTCKHINEAENKLQNLEKEIKLEDKAPIIKTEHPVPVKRRVPLITLSSPKKKKKVETESHVL